MSDWKRAIFDDGHLLARSVLTRDEVDALRVAFPASTPGATLHVDPDDTTPNIEAWRGLARKPDVAALLIECLDEYGLHVHGRDPGHGAGAQGLHADRPPGRVHPVDGITLIWMLDEFTDDNGATRVVPGSHRGATAVPRHLAQPDDRHPDEIIVRGNAGDVLIFDSHLWHSGRRNLDGGRRRAVQMTATQMSLMSPPV